MDRILLRSAIVLLLAGSSCAAVPDQATLDVALAEAQKTWGVYVETSIRMSDATSCAMSRVGQPEGAALDAIAVTRLIKTGDAKRWSIAVNSACAWAPWYLRKVVLHEYGHVLGLEHSKNPASIMYWLVFSQSAARNYGTQKVLPEDRSAAAKLRLSGR